MPDNYINLYVHLVWATWDRAPLLIDRYEWEVQAAIKTSAASTGADVLAIGGMPDHVHLLTSLPSTIALSEFVKTIKGTSSHLANHALGFGGGFKWQGSYACFGVSEDGIPHVRSYIAHQREHHDGGTLDSNLEIDHPCLHP